MRLLCFSALNALFSAATPWAPAAPGDVEPGFNPDANRTVLSASFEPAGKIIITGDFSTIGGVGRNGVARLHANGTLDTSFNHSVNGYFVVDTAAIQPDGKILIAGILNSVGGITRNNIARLNADGSLDGNFNPDANDEVRTIAIQPDGRMIAVGLFTTIGGVTRNRVARLNADGSLDAGFNPNANALVRTPALQADGKIVIGGTFTTVGGMSRNLIARLNADGSVDAAFNPDVTGTALYCVEVQADGKILVGGIFTAVGGVPRTNIARLHPDGTLDAGFTATANALVRSTVTQTDGQMVLAGGFTMVNGLVRNRTARLYADGTLDTEFDPDANGVVWGTSVQPDGKVIIGGEFTVAGGGSRNYIARLDNHAATQSLTVTGSDRVQWLRGGASPETRHVTFDLSTDNGNTWTPLGDGARIAGGWERTGLSLPLNGRVRARARLAGGYANGSSSLVESVTSFTITPLQAWRQTHFGTMENTGDAANNADPDMDTIDNLLEFGFGLNPNKAGAGGLPSWHFADDDYVFSFTQPAGVGGITYFAEYSTTLATGMWTEIPNSSAPPLHTYFAPAGTGQRMYLRLRVTVP